MSVELVVALFAGLVSLTTAVGAILIALYNGKLAREAADRARLAVENADRIEEHTKVDAVKKDEQLKEIHVMVNSNLEEAKARIKELERQLLALTESVVGKAV